MYATGFETLIGYLFMDDQESRMEYLIQRSFEIADGIKTINKGDE
jgi:ribonuclease-3 family protein